MDIPHEKGRPVGKVRFETNSESSSATENDDDSVFNKYSCTPPVRTAVKGMQRPQQKRKDQRPSSLFLSKSSTSTYGIDLSPEETNLDNSTVENGKAFRPALHTKWQQREISKQRDNARLDKWLISTQDSDAMENNFKIENSATSSESNCPRVPPVLVSPGAASPPGLKVESRNRFMSLCSRLIKLPRQMRKKKLEALQNKMLIAGQSRGEFQEYLTDLMKTKGISEKDNDEAPTPGRSDEQMLWQSELKDLMWLELQAWVSDRSPQDQDAYFLEQRSKIPGVLGRIMDYRFEPVPVKKCHKDVDTTSDHNSVDNCGGCLDAFCDTCTLNLSKALHQVSLLFKELDEVEELYPSSRSMALDYPLYGSVEFNDRIKAMCLWYNVTCLLQLKIDIIGRMLVSLGSKGLPWPTWPPWPPIQEEVFPFNNFNGDTDEHANKTPDVESGAFVSPVEPSTSTPVVGKKKVLKRERSRVQFFFSNDSSNNQVERTPLEDSPTTSLKSEYSGADLTEADSSIRDDQRSEAQRQRPRLASLETASETNSETSNKFSSSESLDGRLLYRDYLERALKSNGLRKMLRWLVIVHRASMARAKESLLNPDKYEDYSCSLSPQLDDELDPISTHTTSSDCLELRRFGAWSPEIKLLGLPQYRTLYLFLTRIPVDVIRESLCIRLEQKPAEPSPLSIRQLMQEFKEGLKVGIICKQKYSRDVKYVMPCLNDQSPQPNLERDLNDILKQALMVYLDYVQKWVGMFSPVGVGVPKTALESEWNFTRSVCSSIPGGEILAGKAFCEIAAFMLRSTGSFLRDGIQNRISLQAKNNSSDTEERIEKDDALIFLRKIQQVLSDSREQCLKAVSVTKMLRRDMEVAAEFDISTPITELLKRLEDTGHVRVILPHSESFTMFVPGCLKDRVERLHFFLNLSSRSEFLKDGLEADEFTGKSPETVEDLTDSEGYLLLLKSQTEEEGTIEKLWKGDVVHVCTFKEDTILHSHVQGKRLLLVVFKAIQLPIRRQELAEVLGPGIKFRTDNSFSNYLIAESIQQLKNEVNTLSNAINDAIRQVIAIHSASPDFLEHSSKTSRWKEVVRHCFKLGFDFDREVLRLVSGKPNPEMAKNVVQLAYLWIEFVLEHSERGRGLRPKWATRGLDFLLTACESEITSHLSDDEFSQLKQAVSRCVCHVIGTLSQRPRTSSPSPSTSRLYQKNSSSRLGNSLSVESISPLHSPRSLRKASFFSSRDDSNSPSYSRESSTEFTTSDNNSSCINIEKKYKESLKIPLLGDQGNGIQPWKVRIPQVITKIESQRDEALDGANLIGRVAKKTKEAKWHVKLRSVNFTWQRGVKIGQGRFGKVYVAVNNQTGDSMAMKEIALQPNDHRTIRSIADEIGIFEGIIHPHLVRYYGLEVHREEMIIFMEYCPEGTLEQLCSSTDCGLPEEQIRSYTRQLLEAVAVLHENGIVHRDIKGANIFLVDGGNNLKLGDFGCAAKIKSHTTVVGELQEFVGTQAFMAPEVFMQSMAEGHGRAADIWSVGCVVIEMATGKRPWHELQSCYAIMFRVGMGEVPPTPPTLSKEGQAFLSLLLQHDPKQRETAFHLLAHTFLKVYEEEDNDNRHR